MQHTLSPQVFFFFQKKNYTNKDLKVLCLQMECQERQERVMGAEDKQVLEIQHVLSHRCVCFFLFFVITILIIMTI